MSFSCEIKLNKIIFNPSKWIRHIFNMSNVVLLLLTIHHAVDHIITENILKAIKLWLTSVFRSICASCFCVIPFYCNSIRFLALKITTVMMMRGTQEHVFILLIAIHTDTHTHTLSTRCSLLLHHLPEQLSEMS